RWRASLRASAPENPLQRHLGRSAVFSSRKTFLFSYEIFFFSCKTLLFSSVRIRIALLRRRRARGGGFAQGGAA
ncbi:MAG TPA: hypothetical protein VM692_04515, partial [Gammaproteobacteria bacterium]|nr:hypothetical protein [Gammaproteobacteria bacterium]